MAKNSQEVCRCEYGKFIYPLFGHITDDWENETYDISSRQLIDYQELLEEKMKEYQLCNGQGMEQFFDSNADVQSKLKSIVWNFEEFDGKLYGVTTAELSGEINAKGIADLKDWISGQNSDGLGEGFEQQDFDVDEGDCRYHYGIFMIILSVRKKNLNSS